MWYVMANVQQSYDLSDRLIRAISNWQLTGREDNVEQLLDEGAEVNRLHGTLLPLHCACMVGDCDSLSLLVQRGADVNAIDGYGRAAIHYAAEKDVECVQMLVSYGAEVDITDSNQCTALHWASFKDNALCVRELLQNGANVNKKDYNNGVPLSWAAMKGNLETIKILLEYNAQVDIIDCSGSTPLMKACFIQTSGLNTDKDDACLELLLKASGQFDMRVNGNLPDHIKNDNKISDLIEPFCKNSRALQCLCRFAVRKYLGKKFLPNVVPKLPLPNRLQEYVLLQR